MKKFFGLTSLCLASTILIGCSGSTSSDTQKLAPLTKDQNIGGGTEQQKSGTKPPPPGIKGTIPLPTK